MKYKFNHKKKCIISPEGDELELCHVTQCLNDLMSSVGELKGYLTDKTNTVINKQNLLSAALIMIKTMHRQPVTYAEILSWLDDYVENKENESQFIPVYDFVNTKKSNK